MPDVGVLNLQIQDNSERAVQGLDKLVGALERVKNAVSGSLKLGSIASGLKKIGDVVNDSISGSTIAKIGQLADELSKLKGLGDINIKINSGTSIETILDAVRKTQESMNGVNSGMESVGETAGRAKGDIDAINTGFDDVGRRASAVVGDVERLRDTLYEAYEVFKYQTPDNSWTDGIEKFRELMYAWLDFKSSIALGPGFELSTDAVWDDWKNGAIEAEGTVTDAIESLDEPIADVRNRLTGMVEEAGEATSIIVYGVNAVTSAVQEETNNVDAATEAWRRQAEQIAKAQEAAFYGTKKPRFYNRDTTNRMADQLTELDLLKAKLREAEMAYFKFVNSLGPESSKTIKAGLAVSNLRDKIWEYNQELEKTNNQPFVNGMEQVEKYLNTDSIELMTEKLQDMKASLAEDINLGNISTQQTLQRAEAIKRLSDRIERLKLAQQDVADETEETTGAFSRFTDGLKKMFPTISQLLTRFKSIAKYRMLRKVISSITSGVKEGLKNVYFYSKAVGTSFGPAMDDAASSLQQMKNSIGAALQPVLEALIPILNTIVNWFITAINAANQFFALITGQKTWTRAIKTTAQAFDDQTKSTKKASSAMKELLADWDELNIIQSETGGGTGSIGGTKAEDYLKMFEEVSDFEKEIKSIADFVNGFIDIIDEHMGGILEVAKLIGIAILGWKMSGAFEGVLGTLGQLTAGVIAVTLGLQLSYGSGFEAGQEGGFDWDSLVGAIGGAIAAGIGGYIIAGTPGLAIGVGVSIIATLTGYIEGQKDRDDQLKWGENSLTPEEIDTYIQSKFKFDVTPTIEVLDSVVSMSQDARKKVETRIARFSASLNKITLNAKIDSTALTEAENEAIGLIDDINEFIKTNNKAITTTLEILPLEGNADEDLLSGLKVADKSLSDYFTDLGKQISRWIDQGQRTEWKNGEDKMALELMERERNIVMKAKQGQNLAEYMSDSSLNLANLTRDNAGQVLEREKEILDKFRSSAEQAIKEEAMNAIYLADLAEQAAIDAESQGLDDKAKELRDSAQQYREAAAALLDPETLAERINAKVSEATESMRSEWIKAIQNVYGVEITPHDVEGLRMTNVFRQIFGRDDPFTEGLKAAMDNGGADQAAKYLNESLGKLFENVDPTGIMGRAMSTFGFGYFDFMTDDVKKKYIDTIRNSIGNDDTAKEILKAMGVSAEYIEAAFKSEIDQVEVSQADANRMIMDIFEDNNWQNMTMDELRELFGTLSEFYGAENVENAIREFMDMPESDIDYITGRISDSPITVPPVDLNGYTESLTAMDKATTDTVENVKNTLKGLNANWDIEYYNDPYGYGGSGGRRGGGGVIGGHLRIEGIYANGGFPKSGDLLMADENGNFEMKGRMGNQPVVANNQQIVDGISNGVGRANEDVVSELRIMNTLMQRLLNKELVARATPSSSWGRNNERSAEAFGRVTG